MGERGLKNARARKKWRRKAVEDVVALLKAALEPDDVVIGGGNARLLKELPPGCRVGDNANAFAGGFRLWDEPKARGRRVAKKVAKKAKG